MRRICALILIAAMVLSLSGCKSNDYKEAMELYVNKEYDAALAIFTELGDYEDSANMVTKCRYAQACEQMQDGLYEDARVIFEALGDYEDSVENVRECYYRQAIVLMDEKQYDAAEEIFAMLGDYKDSADYADGMGWYLFLNYVAEQGEVNPEGILFDHSGEIYVEDDCLYVEIGNDIFTAKAVIRHDSPRAELYADYYFEIGATVLKEKGFTKWNISKYTQGDLISWDEYEHYDNGKKYNGQPTSAPFPKLLPDETGANLISALTDCIEKGIAQSGLDVTMADLGFTSYTYEPILY